MTPLLLTAIASLALAAPRGAAQETAPSAAAPPTASSDRPFDLSAIDRMADAMAGIEGGPPGAALVVVSTNGAAHYWVHGVRDAQSGAPLETSTPVYIASVTKSYVGLLAAELDRRGVFDLDQTVADGLPGAELPEPASADAVTFRDLLSHQGHFTNDPLEFRTAYAAAVAPKEYATLVSRFSTYVADDFSYRNVGYLLYVAALELKTGRSWKAWLDEVVLKPLNLRRTSASPNARFGQKTLASGHQLTDQGWHVLAPKPDALMHAAGGISSSIEDAGAFLRAVMVRNGLPAETFEDALTVQVHFEPEEILGMMCDGYALGWFACEYDGLQVYQHGGTYDGFRALYAFSPELGVGIAALVPTDHLGAMFGQFLVLSVLDLACRNGEADSRREARSAEFARSVPAYLAYLIERRDNARSRIPTGWKPTPEELGGFEGVYAHDGYGQARLELEGDHLLARFGAYEVRLEPSAPDDFAGYTGPLALPEQYHFQRDEAGQVSAFDWDGYAVLQKIH
jgi:CubicO group peptidase (beta-lactamase class C family)